METTKEIHDAIQWCIDKLNQQDRKLDEILRYLKNASEKAWYDSYDGKKF